jgi:hypothetical protein
LPRFARNDKQQEGKVLDFDIWDFFVIWILTFGFLGQCEEGGIADTIFLLLMGD